MLKFALESRLEVEPVLDAVSIYGRNFERAAADEAMNIMRANIRIVPSSAKPSPPGGFPYSRTGKLPGSIVAVETNEGYVVGPTPRQPESDYTLRGATTIAELINDGGTLVTRRKLRRKRGRFSGNVTVRQHFRPRPYIQLTLDILADQLPNIANEAQFN